jgi:hypothetical protein
MKRNLQQTTGLGASTAMPGEAVGPANARPEFMRLPKSGSLCPWSGLSRSKLNELILPSPLNGHRPPVRSISLRNRGQIRAVRLINFDSLMAYLRSLEVTSDEGGTIEATNEAPNFPTTHESLETRSHSQSQAYLPRTGNRSGNR